MDFQATATYSADIVGVTILMDNSATVRVRNRDGQGNTISEIDISIPSDHSASVRHQRTGESGFAIEIGLADAISAVVSSVGALLSRTITSEKHAL